MTRATAAKVLGREPFTIVEIDLDYCTHTYGVAPCAAVLGTTGPIKCFNTRKTCQDSNNYASAIKTYRFSDRIMPIGGPSSIPSLISASSLPTLIDPGKGIGQRSSVTLTFQDAPLSDRNIDKYVSTRPYNSEVQGTFWGKLIARNTYYQNRVVRVMSGYVTGGVYDATTFTTRVYLLDTIAGPDSRGMVTVTAKDILKLVADDRTKVPAISEGKLTTNIDAVVTTFSVTAGTGIGYSVGELVVLGSELMSIQTIVTDTFTVLRGRQGSTASTHNAGDVVQICLQYTDALIQDIVYDLMTVQGTVPVGYINKLDWDDEISAWLPLQRMTTIICAPVGITDLLDELCEQGLIYVWWDEIAQQVKLRAIRPARGDDIAQLTGDSNILADSVSIADKPVDRVSQVWVFYGQIDPTKNLDIVANYSKSWIEVDTDAESAAEYGEKKIKVIYSRWLPTSTDLPAQLLATRLTARYRDNPRTVTFMLDAKDGVIWTGDIVELTCRQTQDPTGAQAAIQLQVISAEESKAGTTYTYQLTDSFFTGRYGFITPNTMPDYSAATANQRNQYGFISPNSNVFADGGTAYKVI